MKVFNLFISHSWTYGDQYERLVDLLASQTYFEFKDYSVPRDDPVHTSGSVQKLREAIWRQMRPAHVVLVLAGVYATYSRWIKEEINLAKEMGKPIIAVAPWGADKISSVVRENADRIVRWNSSSIVQAIRELAK